MLFAFTNSKGGVGKSTLAVHSTIWLAEKGKSVALVDADVQGSSSTWLKEVSAETPLFRLRERWSFLKRPRTWCCGPAMDLVTLGLPIRSMSSSCPRLVCRFPAIRCCSSGRRATPHLG